MNKTYLTGLREWLTGWGLRLCLAFTIALLACVNSHAQSSVKLSWAASTNTGVAGYKIYYGLASRTYTNAVDVGTNRVATIGNLIAGTNYYFAITAYNSAKLQGGYSPEVMAITPPNSFFNGQLVVSNSVLALTFANGVLFGNYSVASYPWIYHQDLGLVYFSLANDGKGGIYLKDSATSTTWYTNPSVWPEMYDGGLKAWTYYYPDTKRPGHYTSSPRTFKNMSSGKNISK